MNSLLKLDLRDTDSNYAVDMRDKSIIVSKQRERERKRQLEGARGWEKGGKKNIIAVNKRKERKKQRENKVEVREGSNTNGN